METLGSHDRAGERRAGKTSAAIVTEGERTSIVRANTVSHSLRTTVPKGIVGHFGLRAGDTAVWSIVPTPDHSGLVIAVTPDKVRRA
jgi:hypothetical protein